MVPEAEVALSVDGLLARGPNLSHWPGNRTPAAWKADLSTGICLEFARAPRREREEFLNGVSVVANDHYDTDGMLSLLAVLAPETALAHAELCLAAAATGDYQVLVTPRAFAIDRLVAGLARPESPVAAEFSGLRGAEKDLARYRWLLDHPEVLLGTPEEFSPLWEAELASIQHQLRECRTGSARRTLLPHAGLSVVRSAAPLHRLALNTFAGAYRVLHILETPAGPCYRYHDRTESWFEVVSFAPPPRTDLSRARQRLCELEPADEAGWWHDPSTEPVPELYHGIASAQVYGAVTRELRPSRLAPETVVAVLAEELALVPSPT